MEKLRGLLAKKELPNGPIKVNIGKLGVGGNIEIAGYESEIIFRSGEKDLRTPRSDLAKAQVLLRVGEARSAARKQQRLTTWARLSSNSLTFGQYVIGGVMATSFAQKSLSPDIIGIFGLLVVAASLLKQHYHPDVNAQNAAQHAAELEALIRQSEDRLVVIAATRDSNDDPNLLLELLEKLSADLTKITLTPISSLSSTLRKGKK